MLQRFLCERKIPIGEKEHMKMTAGVPQGSVFGPKLWNVLYENLIYMRIVEGA